MHGPWLPTNPCWACLAVTLVNECVGIAGLNPTLQFPNAFCLQKYELVWLGSASCFHAVNNWWSVGLLIGLRGIAGVIDCSFTQNFYIIWQVYLALVDNKCVGGWKLFLLLLQAFNSHNHLGFGLHLGFDESSRHTQFTEIKDESDIMEGSGLKSFAGWFTVQLCHSSWT